MNNTSEVVTYIECNWMDLGGLSKKWLAFEMAKKLMKNLRKFYYRQRYLNYLQILVIFGHECYIESLYGS